MLDFKYATEQIANNTPLVKQLTRLVTLITNF